MAYVNEDGSVVTTRSRGFFREIAYNYRVVKNNFKLKLYQRTLLFFILVGITKTNYNEYMYYFKLEVA